MGEGAGTRTLLHFPGGSPVLPPPIHPPSYPPAPGVGEPKGRLDACRKTAFTLCTDYPARPPTPISTLAGPYRTSKLRGLPAGTPETRGSPGFVRHRRSRGSGATEAADNGLRGWGGGSGAPGAALRQPLRPVPGTAETEPGGRGDGEGEGRRGEAGEEPE